MYKNHNSIKTSDFCQGHNFQSIEASNLNFHIQIDHIKEKCSVQELITLFHLIIELVPFLNFCPGDNFQSIQEQELYTVYKNYNSIESIFRVIALCKFNFGFLSWA